MAQGDDNGHREHANCGYCSSQIKEQQSMTEHRRVWTTQDGQVAKYQQNADLRGTEDALRKLKAGQAISRQITFA